MTRHGSRMAVAVALIVLQQPLCGLACLFEASEPQHAAVHETAHEHAPASDPAPDESDHHDDCTCATHAELAVASSFEQTTVSPGHAAMLSTVAPTPVSRVARGPRAVPPNTHLPPRDILLEKSSFLI